MSFDLPLTERALVVGEALIDVVRQTDGTTTEHPGGSPANVALTLGRLERPVELLTWIGRDARGDALRSWLADSDVSLAPGAQDVPSTSVAVAHLGADGAATYDFDLTWDLSHDAQVPDGTIVAHTCSVAAVLEPGATAVRRVLGSARARATITYDPNVRPSLMGTAAAARPQIEELVRFADVVKVSDEDLHWLYPAADLDAVARQWQESGPSLVVVTYGGEGARAYTMRGRVDVAAPDVTVADTVGAGDSFMGALVDGLWTEGLLGASRRGELAMIETETLTVVLKKCVRVAAITVSRPGANPPRRAELTA